MFILSLIFATNTYFFSPTDELLQKMQPIVDKIERCESNMNQAAYNPVDSDGKEKFGCMQFDIDTATDFMNRYGMYDPDVKAKLYDCNFSRRLSALMINDGFGSRWGCWNKIKLKIT